MDLESSIEFTEGLKAIVEEHGLSESVKQFIKSEESFDSLINLDSNTTCIVSLEGIMGNLKSRHRAIKSGKSWLKTQSDETVMVINTIGIRSYHMLSNQQFIEQNKDVLVPGMATHKDFVIAVKERDNIWNILDELEQHTRRLPVPAYQTRSKQDEADNKDTQTAKIILDLVYNKSEIDRVNSCTDILHKVERLLARSKYLQYNEVKGCTINDVALTSRKAMSIMCDNILYDSSRIQKLLRTSLDESYRKLCNYCYYFNDQYEVRQLSQKLGVLHMCLFLSTSTLIHNLTTPPLRKVFGKDVIPDNMDYYGLSKGVFTTANK